jgi:hypothetical protein
VVVDLVDDRSVSVPLVWYPRLLQESVEERQQFRLIGGGEGIPWGSWMRTSAWKGSWLAGDLWESAESFRRWLEDRNERSYPVTMESSSGRGIRSN